MGLTDRWGTGIPDLPRLTGIVTSASTGCEHLLLAPLDEDARHVMERALRDGGFAFTTRGRLLTVSDAPSRLPSLATWLPLRTSAALRSRVKAALVSDPDDPEALVEACLGAQPLTEFFDLAEVDWIRVALRDNWLYSVFQPVVEASTGQVFGYEALVRARNPQSDELVTAGQLIYAATRLNLQHHFDQAARITAIRQAAQLGDANACYFVNFSPSAIYEPEVCLRSTVEAADECGMPLSRIVFDMVDVSEMEDADGLGAILDYYRRRGARIALDDVTGSLSTLQLIADLRPDFIKIDCSVIATASPMRSRMRLEPIVSLARSLNLQVIAEGVETSDQMTLCREAGVDYMQGFLLAHPANPPMAVQPGLFGGTDLATAA